MREETTYCPSDLEEGECISCREESNEILKRDGRCIDCIEEEKFYEKCIEGL